ncbi:MAG: SRPBCC family protein [Parvularculaceae bacterium]
MSAISTVVTASVEAPLARTFEIAVPIDVLAVMKPRGFLPGVARVENQTGPWNAVGQNRRLYLTDGSSVFEEIIDYAANHHFAYTVSRFTGVFSALVREARGEWNFTQTATGRTQIDWTYAFTPKSMLARPFVWLIVKLLWSGYMRKALTRTAEIVEKDAS